MRKKSYAWMICWEGKKVDVDLLSVDFFGIKTFRISKSQGSSKIMLKFQCLV